VADVRRGCQHDAFVCMVAFLDRLQALRPCVCSLVSQGKWAHLQARLRPSAVAAPTPKIARRSGSPLGFVSCAAAAAHIYKL